jgi:uncharacterized protein YfkK (UPF0435 family)
MEIISENEILNAFNLVMPYLRIFFDNEATFAVSDREKFLNNLRADGKSYVGTPIAEGGSAYRAIREGRPIIDFVQKHSIKSYSVPVKGKDGRVEGCIIVGKSTKKRQELLDLSRSLSTALKEISDVVNDFSSKLQTVVEMNLEASKKIDEAHENASNTGKIFDFIRQVSSQTDLLGINASIEATRAGAEGRGFKVIAQEIRKLSETSRESVDKIYTTLNAINQSVDDICTTTTKTQEITESYSEAFTEIATTVKRLSLSAQELEAMADKV